MGTRGAVDESGTAPPLDRRTTAAGRSARSPRVHLARLTAAVSRVILRCGEHQAGDSSDEDPEEDVPLHGPDGEAYASA
jgi:hypothetical protein